MDVKRAQIRRYITAALKESVDVGGKVYSCRPDPVFLEELPCVLVYYSDEGAETFIGDRYNQKTIERKLRVNVDIWSDQQLNPDVDFRANEDGEDFLDYLGWQVEHQNLLYSLRQYQRLLIVQFVAFQQFVFLLSDQNVR